MITFLDYGASSIALRGSSANLSTTQAEIDAAMINQLTSFANGNAGPLGILVVENINHANYLSVLPMKDVQSGQNRFAEKFFLPAVDPNKDDFNLNQKQTAACARILLAALAGDEKLENLSASTVAENVDTVPVRQREVHPEREVFEKIQDLLQDEQNRVELANVIDAAYWETQGKQQPQQLALPNDAETISRNSAGAFALIAGLETLTHPLAKPMLQGELSTHQLLNDIVTGNKRIEYLMPFFDRLPNSTWNAVQYFRSSEVDGFGKAPRTNVFANFKDMEGKDPEALIRDDRSQLVAAAKWLKAKIG